MDRTNHTDYRLPDRVPRRGWSAARAAVGQTVVEFALTLPIFLLMVFSTIDFARGVVIFTALQDSAREGARYAVVHPTDTAGISAAVRQRATIVTGPDPLTVTIAYPAGSPPSRGDPVVVTVQYQFHPLTLFVFPGGSGGISLTTHSQMLTEP